MPEITDPKEAEFFYQDIAENRKIKPEELECRVQELRWVHNGMKMVAQIGKPLNPYFKSGDDPVLAIFEVDNCYIICTHSRGGPGNGPAVFAGKSDAKSVKYFDS
ncbi:MAG: hypothetical protein H8D23_26715 [Candidatus Brocadiales bacterium]|nr:hypothetical protein [Candidatus Brocadiales bacterium]